MNLHGIEIGHETPFAKVSVKMSAHEVPAPYLECPLLTYILFEQGYGSLYLRNGRSFQGESFP